MLRWEEIDSAFKPQAIVIVSTFVGPLIPHGGGLQFAQLFLLKMVLSPLGIHRVITVLVCTQLYNDSILLRLHMIATCSPIQLPLFS